MVHADLCQNTCQLILCLVFFVRLHIKIIIDTRIYMNAFLFVFVSFDNWFKQAYVKSASIESNCFRYRRRQDERIFYSMTKSHRSEWIRIDWLSFSFCSTIVIKVLSIFDDKKSINFFQGSRFLLNRVNLIEMKTFENDTSFQCEWKISKEKSNESIESTDRQWSKWIKTKKTKGKLLERKSSSSSSSFLSEGNCERDLSNTNRHVEHSSRVNWIVSSDLVSERIFAIHNKRTSNKDDDDLSIELRRRRRRRSRRTSVIIII